LKIEFISLFIDQYINKLLSILIVTIIVIIIIINDKIINFNDIENISFDAKEVT